MSEHLLPPRSPPAARPGTRSPCSSRRRQPAGGTPHVRAAALVLALSLTAAPAASHGSSGALPAPRGASAPAPGADDRAPRRVALLIGIGDYVHFEPGGPRGRTDLEGPPNDVSRMRRSLRRYGFGGDDPSSEADVRVLRDGEATFEAIEEGFRWLASRATDTADVVVVYYSGHGSFAEDRDGDEAELSPGDRHDEALVPADATDITDPEQLVLDDHIRAWLGALGTRNVTLVVDACYSGTVTRAAPGSSARARGPVGNPGGGGATEALLHPEHTLLTAAGPEQTALEREIGGEGRTYGVFTYHLTRALDGAGPNARYDDVVRRVRLQVAGEKNTRQVPQLEGDGSARLFRVRGDLPRRQYAVLRRIGGVHVIDAGAVHGVRPTALFDVHGPGETDFRGAPIARVVVDSVAETRAYVRPLEAGASLPSPARAVLARIPSGAGRVESLGVHLGGEARALGLVLDSLGFVHPADSADADAWVVRDGPGYRVFVDGLEVVPLPRSDRERPHLVGGEGRGDHRFRGTREGMCDPLRRAFSIASLGAIENPEWNSDLWLELRVVEAGRRPAAGLTEVDTAYVGRRYDLLARVEAPEGLPVYLTVAVQGYADDPLVLHPRGEGMNSPVPTDAWLPLLRGFRATGPPGLEVLTAVVSAHQYDLRPLVSALDRLCRGERGRRAPGTPADTAADVGWTSLERRVLFLPDTATAAAPPGSGEEGRR